jgi:hypothetical protein
MQFYSGPLMHLLSGVDTAAIQEAFARTAAIREAFARTAAIQEAFARTAAIQEAVIGAAAIREAVVRTAAVQEAAIGAAATREAVVRTAAIQEAAIRETAARLKLKAALTERDQSNSSETTVEMKHRAVVPERLVKEYFSVSSNLARPDDLANVIIPEIGLKLLPFIVPKKLRDAVTGDLTEDFRTFAAQWGRSYALRVLWWELAGLCIRRFGPTAIVMGIGVWVRQKLGW